MKVCKNCRYYVRLERPYSIETTTVRGECFSTVKCADDASFHIFNEQTGCNGWRAKGT